MNASLTIPARERICLVGIDTTQPRVPLVITFLEEDYHCPEPVEDARFDCLEDFVDYWHGSLSSWGAHFAVPRYGPDPLSIRAWLEAKGQPLERYEWMDYRAHLKRDLGRLGLATDFERPYALALYAAYRRRAGPMARGVLARLFEAQYLIEETRNEMHRLAAALSVPWFSPEPEIQLDDLPF